VTSAAGPVRPRRWAAGLAWALWALVMLGLAAVPWIDRLMIRAGRPDLALLVPGNVVGPVVAVLSAATVGAVLASRRPRHPVGWLLLGFALALTATGVITSYLTYGLLARPGALPALHLVARYYPATGAAALALLSLVLLLTPTGSLPSPRWRRWTFITAATPVALVLVVPGGARTVGPAAAAGQQSLQRPRPGRGPAGRHPGRPGRHRPGRGRRRRVAAAVLPPRPRGRTRAAALGGVGGGPDGAGGADRPGLGGVGEPDLGQLGVRGLGGGAAGGGGRADPALSPV
jgi:hypothetical protein